MVHSDLVILYSGGVSIVTIFGVQVVKFFTELREEKVKMKGKEFDDGVQRRKELIIEIDKQRAIIDDRDRKIAESLVRIEALKDQMARDAIRYIQMENKFNDVVEELSRFSAEMAAKFKQ